MWKKIWKFIKLTFAARVAVFIGIILGFLIGMGLQWLTTPNYQPTTVEQMESICVTAPPNPLRKLNRSYWGCERSLAKTINEARSVCLTSTTCAGTCTNTTKTCQPGYPIIHSVVQTPGFFSCDTQIWYQCACTCQ